MPPILGTIASPLQYGYRTKITPHFEAPPRRVQKSGRPSGEDETIQPDWLKIGFNQIGKRITMDIEVGSVFRFSFKQLYIDVYCAGLSYRNASAHTGVRSYAGKHH